MKEIIARDQQLMIALNTLGEERFDAFWLTVTQMWIWVPLFVTFLYFLVKNYGWRDVFYLLIFVGLGITVSDQLANVSKGYFERLRPCHDPIMEGKIREVVCGGKFGFYSAHASSMFFIATYLAHFLGHKVKGIFFIVFPWAALIAYSRVYLGVHYPSDILIGAGVGVFLGRFFVVLAQKTLKKKINSYS